MLLRPRGFELLVACATAFLALPREALAQTGVAHSQEISSSAGGFSGELDYTDELGFATAAIGDLDGNGVVDVALSAHRDGDGGSIRGAVWILSLASDGTVLWHQKISSTEGGFAGPLDDLDLFGFSISALGDLDEDGTLELAVGAPGDDDGGEDAGAVWVLSLDAAGTVVRESKVLPVDPAHEEFGFALTALGDLDGDGVGDLAVSDRAAAAGGKIRLLFLNADASVRAVRTVDPAGYGGQEPWGLASLRDVDGDGVSDLAAGTSGEVHVLFLTPTGGVAHVQAIGDGTGGFTGEIDDLDQFGVSVASRGDLDGDLVPDLVVGAPQDDDGGQWSGAVWILFLEADGTVASHQKISRTEGGFGGDVDDRDRFGRSVAVLGDVDRFGLDDLAVGAPFANGAEFLEGAAWILLLGEACPGVPCATLGTRYCTAVANSTGFPGQLFVEGSRVVADDELTLVAAPLPPEPNIGYFLMGTGQNTFTPPGSDGPICVAPGILRFLPPVEHTQELNGVYGLFTGGFRRVVGTSGPVSGAITAGSTWNFQAWHRDALFGTSNLTDAVSVVFQ